MVIADTSVWISHLTQKNSHLEALLDEGLVAVHPFVIGELACGRLKNRREILHLLQALPDTPVAQPSELLYFIDQRGLAGSGIGLVDAHLLASSELMKVMLWTSDKSLQRIATALNLAYV